MPTNISLQSCILAGLLAAISVIALRLAMQNLNAEELTVFCVFAVTTCLLIACAIVGYTEEIKKQKETSELQTHNSSFSYDRDIPCSIRSSIDSTNQIERTRFSHDFYKLLAEQKFSVERGRDKVLLTLSSGLFGASVAGLWQLLKTKQDVSRVDFLMETVCFLFISIFLVLGSSYFSSKQYDRVMENMSAAHEGQPEKSLEKLIMIEWIFTFASYLSLFAGAAFFGTFVLANIPVAK